MEYKVGDKIQLKNIPKQVNLNNKYINTLNDIVNLLKRKNRNDKFKTSLYRNRTPCIINIKK